MPNKYMLIRGSRLFDRNDRSNNISFLFLNLVSHNRFMA